LRGDVGLVLSFGASVLEQLGGKVTLRHGMAEDAHEPMSHGGGLPDHKTVGLVVDVDHEQVAMFQV
jgi:hypothetical protein